MGDQGKRFGYDGLAGTSVWDGITHVLAPVTMTFSEGEVIGQVGGAWEPLVYVVYLGGALLVGRVWRAWPAWRTKQQEQHSN